MTKLQSDIDIVVNPEPGHSIRFTAGVPREVADRFESACLDVGCERVKPPKKEIGASQVARTIRDIIESGEVDKMDKDGNVTREALNKALGSTPKSAIIRKARQMVEKGEA